MTTTKSKKEIRSEIDGLRIKLEKYKGNELRLVDLERQLDATLYDLGIHQEELSVQNEELARSREKLESLFSKYSVLFEDSPVGYFVFDQRQRVVESNQAGARLLNVAKEFLLGKPLISLVNRTHAETLGHHFKRVFDGDQAVDEIELSPADGDPIPCIVRSHRITDPESGKPVCLTVVFDISERKRNEQRIAQLSERNRRILDAAEEGIVGIGGDGRIVFANPAAEKALQWADSSLLGKNSREILRPRNLDGALVSDKDFAVTRTLRDGAVHSVSGHCFQRRNGDLFPVEYVTAPTMEENAVSGLVMTFRDITERKRSEEALQRAHDDLERRVDERTRELRMLNDRLRLTAQVFDSTAEAIVITDAANKIIEVNPAFTKITGYASDEVVGRDPGFMKSGRHDRAFYADMWQKIWKEGYWQGEIWDRRKNGEVYPKWLTINTVKNNSQKPTQCIGVFSDISVVKNAEEELERLAFYDGLTNLPNRTLFKTRLEHEFKTAHRRKTKVALLFLDLDHFKNVNDTLGHAAGDQLLVVMAKRICSCVRESDTVSRLGGDEFTVIVTDVDDAAAVSHVAHNILEALKRPVELEGQNIVAGCSIGIAIHPEDGENSETLIKNADAAMYHAKDSGRNAYAFFTEKLNVRAVRRMDIENGLRQAIDQQQFTLHYQPKVDFKTRRIIGLEALVRWNRPGAGLISPEKFIPVAEETGLIREIGQMVLESACRQVVDLMKGGLPALPVSVNLSVHQLQHPKLIEHLQAALNKSGLPAQLLELEITESMLANDVDAAIVKLNEIRKMGVAISVDDFGTGYSSLSYLKRFPIHTLKIDRSFVQDLPDDSDNAAIVRAIISMAHSLGLGTVAEGIETQSQGEFLNNHACQRMQGFFFSRPLPVPELVEYLKKSDVAPAKSGADGG
ncbi:MAG: EAL domain-containing protein [Magnetococcales bacterium]|nr:EAL domain-containing protein [Magnetococcales bacterium]